MPILFTRYAAAYSAHAEGMAALDLLQPTGNLQAKPGNVSLKTARYGLRMLRAGYLYVRIKRPGLTPEWSGYAVHPHGYLTEFNVMDPQDIKPHPACEVEVRGAIMSMVWVGDPQRVTALNYMFHPDPIDHDHLQKVIEPNLDKYTQGFDVAGWANGNMAQENTTQPGLLNGQVMEFSALSTASVQKVGNEQHYGLMGTHGAERGWGNYTEARHGRHFEKVRHETTGMTHPEANGVTDTGAVAGMAVGPYVAEVLGMRYADAHGRRLKKMAEFLQSSHGAVVACEDPIGITQELSLHHLTAAIPYVAWLKQTDDEDKDPGNKNVTNQWKQTAGESIKTLEAAIYKKAMRVYDEETDRLRQVSEVMDQRHARPVGTVLVEQKDGSYAEIPVTQMEAQRKKEIETQIASRESDRHFISDAEAKAAGDKTRAHYDPRKLESFDIKHSQQIKLRDARMDLLTEDLIAWLGASAFVDKALGRYDKTPAGIDTGDGARCAGQLCAILEHVDSSPRGRRWYAALQLFKDEPKNIVWRMATLNNDEISQELQRVMQALTQTLPAATCDVEVESAEESARKQRAYADMVAALGKIPKTLRGSQTLLDEAGKVLDPKVPRLQKLKSLQTIAKTARENVHAVWGIAALSAVKNIAPSAREAAFAKAQVVQLAHGLGSRAIEIVQKEKIKYDEDLRAKGQRADYSNKRNPEPGGRAWKRKYAWQAQKLDERLARAAEAGKAPAAISLRIPVVFGAVETMSLIVSLRRANERGEDPRAGAEAAAAIFAGMGAWSGGRALYCESNLHNRIQADLSKILPARLKALSTASGAELQMLKIGAAHYVALGALVGVGVDLVAAEKAGTEGEPALRLAYYGRAFSGIVTVGSALGKAWNVRRTVAVLGFTLDIVSTASVVGLVATVAATYVIEKIKASEWVRWLEAEPFRKRESMRLPHPSEDFMVGALGDTIADMN